MHAFLIRHIDALITTIAGLFMTIYTLKNRDRLRASPKLAQRIKEMMQNWGKEE